MDITALIASVHPSLVIDVMACVTARTVQMKLTAHFLMVRSVFNFSIIVFCVRILFLLDILCSDNVTAMRVKQFLLPNVLNCFARKICPLFLLSTLACQYIYIRICSPTFMFFY